MRAVVTSEHSAVRPERWQYAGQTLWGAPGRAATFNTWVGTATSPKFNDEVLVRDTGAGVTLRRQRDELPAEQARAYFREVGRRFEDYAAERYPQLLVEPPAGDLALLAGVSYVATRAVPGYLAQLQEILTTRRAGATAEAIHAACLDALIATTDDRAATARFLAYVGCQSDPPPGRPRCIAGLQRLQPEATEELLAYLGRSTDGAQRRRLAVLMQRVTGIRSPEPLRFWQQSSDAVRVQATVETWRANIADQPVRSR